MFRSHGIVQNFRIVHAKLTSQVKFFLIDFTMHPCADSALTEQLKARILSESKIRPVPCEHILSRSPFCKRG